MASVEKIVSTTVLSVNAASISRAIVVPADLQPTTSNMCGSFVPYGTISLIEGNFDLFFLTDKLHFLFLCAN